MPEKILLTDTIPAYDHMRWLMESHAGNNPEETANFRHDVGTRALEILTEEATRHADETIDSALPKSRPWLEDRVAGAYTMTRQQQLGNAEGPVNPLEATPDTADLLGATLARDILAGHDNRELGGRGHLLRVLSSYHFVRNGVGYASFVDSSESIERQMRKERLCPHTLDEQSVLSDIAAMDVYKLREGGVPLERTKHRWLGEHFTRNPQTAHHHRALEIARLCRIGHLADSSLATGEPAHYFTLVKSMLKSRSLKKAIAPLTGDEFEQLLDQAQSEAEAIMHVDAANLVPDTLKLLGTNGVVQEKLANHLLELEKAHGTEVSLGTYRGNRYRTIDTETHETLRTDELAQNPKYQEALADYEAAVEQFTELVGIDPEIICRRFYQRLVWNQYLQHYEKREYELVFTLPDNKKTHTIEVRSDVRADDKTTKTDVDLSEISPSFYGGYVYFDRQRVTKLRDARELFQDFFPLETASVYMPDKRMPYEKLSPENMKRLISETRASAEKIRKTIPLWQCSNAVALLEAEEKPPSTLSQHAA